MSKFEIHISKEIEKDVSPELLKALTSAFINYKSQSRKNEHPFPPQNIQLTTQSAEPQFGRDRFETEDRGEDIQHIHLNDGSKSWKDDQGLLEQWKCTSDTHLIYSYFKIDGTYHYYLMEMYTRNAHKEYLKTKSKLYERARDYKEQKLKEYSEKQTKSA